MAIYHAQAELRRLHRDAEWELTGVIIESAWVPAARAIAPASARTIESGNVRVVELPAFLAPDPRSAARVAVEVCQMAGWRPGDVRGSRTLTIGLPDFVAHP